MRLSRELGRIALYFAIPALSAVTPLLAIPVLTSRFGTDGWTSVAIAMSVGGAAAVVAELGWGVVGPQTVAAAPKHERKELYRLAFVSKLTAVSFTAPIVVIVVVLLAPAAPLDAALIAVGTAATALSPAWYFIGEGRPLLILASESLPKLCLVASSALGMAMGAPMWVYAAALLVSPALTAFFGARMIRLKWLPLSKFFRGTGGALRGQFHLTWGRGVSALYTALPTTLLAIVSPDSVAVFSAVERLMRMSALVVGGIPNRLQSWIGSATQAERLRRSRVSLYANGALGVIAGASFGILSPWAASIVFAGKISVPLELSLLSGAVLCVICLSRGFGLAVVARGLANWISLSVLLSATLGVPAILILGQMFGAGGALTGELVAEVTGVLVQLIIIARYRRPGMAER